MLTMTKIENEFKIELAVLIHMLKTYIKNKKTLTISEINEELDDVINFANMVEDVDITDSFLEILSNAIDIVASFNKNKEFEDYINTLDSLYETLLQRSNAVEYNFSKS